MMPQQNQTHEAVASLKLELVTAIRGAFEVAVQIAVREVTELVDQTTDKYLEAMRKENESLSQIWKRGIECTNRVVERGRLELRGSQQHLQKNTKIIDDSSRSTAGQSTMDANCVVAKRQHLERKDKISTFYLDEEPHVISSDEDSDAGHVGGNMGSSSTVVHVKQEEIKEENCHIKVEHCSPRRGSEEEPALSDGLGSWKNDEPQVSGPPLLTSKQIEELAAGRPTQANVPNGLMLPVTSVITGSLLCATDVHLPPSTIHNLYSTLDQTMNPTNLTQTKRTGPFHCSICFRGFNHLMNLKTHLRIHTGERPYTCSICSRCFRHSNALTRHIRIHTGEKPYKCVCCGKAFRHLAGVKKHQRSHK